MITVILTPEAVEQYVRLPKDMRERVRKLIDRLGFWPDVSGVKTLRGGLAGWYRIRTGDYRVRFRIANGVISIDKIGHRKEIYDD